MNNNLIHVTGGACTRTNVAVLAHAARIDDGEYWEFADFEAGYCIDAPCTLLAGGYIDGRDYKGPQIVWREPS